GDSHETRAVSERVDQLGLRDRVFLHENVPHREALRQMARSDVLLAIQPGTALQVPGKLYEMMLFRRPILVLSDGGATAELVASRGLGLVVPNGDPDRIAEGIREARRASRDAFDCRKRCSTTEEFDGRVLTGRLAGVFEDVVGMGNGVDGV